MAARCLSTSLRTTTTTTKLANKISPAWWRPVAHSTQSPSSSAHLFRPPKYSNVSSSRICLFSSAAATPLPTPSFANTTTANTNTNTNTNTNAVSNTVTNFSLASSFYRRPLPSPPATSFSSAEGKRLFREALLEGHMENYFFLAEQFRTQDEPAYCGLTTLTMVLNALSIDPGRVWKGPWRWYTEEMLECCQPLWVVKRDGISFPQLACLARCNGLDVKTVFASSSLHSSSSSSSSSPSSTEPSVVSNTASSSSSSSSLSGEEAFRQAVIQNCTNTDTQLIVSYNRKTFGQSGSGHFSPIGGYHAASNQVLLMDVARFKYPPHWVPLPMLWSSMRGVDSATSMPRGYMIVSPPRSGTGRTLLFTISRHPRWRMVREFFMKTLPAQLQCATCHRPMPASGAACNNNPAAATMVLNGAVAVTDTHSANAVVSNNETTTARIIHDHQLHNNASDPADELVSSLLCDFFSDSVGSNSGLCFLSTYCEEFDVTLTKLTPEYQCAVQHLINEIHSSPVFEYVTGVLQQANSCKSSACSVATRPFGPELATILVLACPVQLWSSLPPLHRDTVLKMVDIEQLSPLLKAEVTTLRAQIVEMVRACEHNQCYPVTQA